MARKIEKKVISDDLLFGDDFDENRLAKMEADLIRTPISEELEKGKPRKRAADDAVEGADPDSRSGLSGKEEDLDSQAPGQPASASEAPGASGTQQAAVARIARSKKLFLLAAACVLLIVVATASVSLYWYLWGQESPAPRTVRHRIVVPSHKHVTSFLLFANTFEKKRDLLKLEVELDFWSANSYEAFKSKQVLFNDVIYKFLRKQEPPDNSFESWEKILSRDLFEMLARSYPETRLSAIEMKNFQRL